MEKAYAIISRAYPTPQPSIPVELILTVVMLIVNQCDLLPEQIAERTIKGSLLDRVRFRYHLSRQGAPNPGQMTRQFFSALALEKKEDVTAAIEELNQAF